MDSLDLAAVVGLVAVSFCVVTAALVAAAHLSERSNAAGHAVFDLHDAEPAVFLFDAMMLVDATDRAHRLLRSATDCDTPREQLLALLSKGFADVGPQLLGLPCGEKIDRWSRDDATMPMRLMAEWRNGMLRITIIQADESEALVAIDAQSLFSMERDVALLGALAEHAPCLIWKSSAENGAVTWANRAYFDLARKTLGEAAAIKWPPPRLFASVMKVEGSANALLRRVSVTSEDWAKPNWFDTQAHAFGDEILHFAVAADSAVRAEGALREFIQTLAKTFAHLPIGLAIFDRRRRLALFNPALTDLSTLPVDFLTGRPSLSAFLDELRNRQMMPEPKDYGSWRQRITALEAEAVKGTYAETWSLSSGKTYRVTGRPHPEGAVAFLFEDISSEVMLTRRFRTDTELGQAILDAVPEALAVFSQTGQLIQSNTAYSDLWGLDARSVIGEISIIDASRNWTAACQPTLVWGDLRDFVGAVSERAEWAAQVSMTSGRTLDCRFVPLPGGRTLVGFTPIAQPVQEIARLRPDAIKRETV